MSKLLVEDKEVVAPGEVLAEGMDYIPGRGAYRLGENILANEAGLVQINGRAIKLVPISGKYIPKIDDTIICKVVDVAMTAWRVDTNSAYSGMIGLKDGSRDFIQRGADLTKIYDIGDWLVAKVTQVTSQMLIDLSANGPGLRKLRGGQVIEVPCKKVPRIIGKQGSMVTLIKDATGCQITVGQNGRVWVNGEAKSQVVAIETINKIVDEAHTSGLTDTIKAFLETKKDYLGDIPKKEDKFKENKKDEYNTEDAG